MLGVTLDEAKTLATILVVGLAIASLAAAWFLNAVFKKLLVGGLLAALALLVWSERAALTECASDVRAAGVGGDTTCSFFGRDVRITAGRSS